MTKPATTPFDLIQATGAIDATMARESERWSVWRTVYKVLTDDVVRYLVFFDRSFRMADVDQVKAWLSEAEVNQPIVIVRESRGKESPQISHINTRLGAAKVMTPNEFLFQVVKTALAPSNVLHTEGDPFFIEPNLRFPDKNSAGPALKQLQDWMLGKHENAANVCVLLAPAGVGKTTLSAQLFQDLQKRISAQIVPLLLVREQWEPLVNRGSVSIRDIWTAGITTWYPRSLLGAENLETYLGAGTIRPIFDGLDELCSNFPGDFSPSALVSDLVDTIEDGRLLLTSRPEFWSESIEPAVRARVLELELSPFTSQQRDDYLLKRFPTAPDKRKAAVRLLERIAGSARLPATQTKEHVDSDTDVDSAVNPAARLDRMPYAVMMAAESVDVGKGRHTPVLLVETEPVTGLVMALCERERIRQRLRLTAQQQFVLMQLLAVEYGYFFDAPALRLAIETVSEDLTAAEIERLQHHALLRIQDDRFSFRYEFLRDYLTAVALLDWITGRANTGITASVALERCAKGATQLPELWVALSSGFVEEEITRALRERWVEVSSVKVRKEGLSQLAVSYARIISKGDKDKATELLLAVIGDATGTIRDVAFRGPVVGLNLTKVSFVGCRFTDTEWSKCLFSAASSFNKCYFEGRLSFKNVSNLGLAKLIDCEFSAPAANAMQIERGNDREFPVTREQILEAIRETVRLFAVGNLGFNPVGLQKLEKHIRDYSFGAKLLRALLKYEVLKKGRLDIAGGAERYEVADSHAIRQLMNNSLAIKGVSETVESLLHPS